MDRLGGGGRRVTLGADKGYDAAAFVAALRDRRVTPHVAVDGRVSKLGVRRGSGVDGRTTCHAGYAASQRARKRIEEVFGWIKSAAGLRQTRHRGRPRVAWQFDLAATAYNLIRLPAPTGSYINSDNIHPNVYGYALVAPMVTQKLIQGLLTPTPRYRYR